MTDFEGQQQQNLHGKHVSKRVRMKLEGMIVTGTSKNDSAKSDTNIESLEPSEQVYCEL